MRDATFYEIEFCKKLKALLRKRPKTMALVADGQLHAVDAAEWQDYNSVDMFQPLRHIEPLGPVDGGDPWK